MTPVLVLWLSGVALGTILGWALKGLAERRAWRRLERVEPF